MKIQQNSDGILESETLHMLRHSKNELIYFFSYRNWPNKEKPMILIGED